MKIFCPKCEASSSPPRRFTPTVASATSLSPPSLSCDVEVSAPASAPHQDIYFPRSKYQGNIDGAYFGTTFPHLFLMTYGALAGKLHGPINDPLTPPPTQSAPPESVRTTSRGFAQGI